MQAQFSLRGIYHLLCAHGSRDGIADVDIYTRIATSVPYTIPSHITSFYGADSLFNPFNPFPDTRSIVQLQQLAFPDSARKGITAL